MLVFAGFKCTGHSRRTVWLLIETFTVKVMNDIGHQITIKCTLLLPWVIEVNGKSLMLYDISEFNFYF